MSNPYTKEELLSLFENSSSTGIRTGLTAKIRAFVMSEPELASTPLVLDIPENNTPARFVTKVHIACKKLGLKCKTRTVSVPGETPALVMLITDWSVFMAKMDAKENKQ